MVLEDDEILFTNFTYNPDYYYFLYVGELKTYSGETDIFITPGYRFQGVGAMLTNFHLPKSSLLMLVSAFAGRELVLEAYEAAVREQYRFYSFGDAMLILP